MGIKWAAIKDVKSNRRKARIASRLTYMAGKNDRLIDATLEAIRRSVEKSNIEDFRRRHTRLCQLLVEEAEELVRAVINEILIIYDEIVKVRKDQELIAKLAQENKISTSDVRDMLREDDETSKQLRQKLSTLSRYIVQEWRTT